VAGAASRAISTSFRQKRRLCIYIACRDGRDHGRIQPLSHKRKSGPQVVTGSSELGLEPNCMKNALSGIGHSVANRKSTTPRGIFMDCTAPFVIVADRSGHAVRLSGMCQFVATLCLFLVHDLLPPCTCDCRLVQCLHYIFVSTRAYKGAMELTSTDRHLRSPAPARRLLPRPLARAGFEDFISNLQRTPRLSSFPPHSRSADGKERHFSLRNCSHPANLGLFIAGPTFRSAMRAKLMSLYLLLGFLHDEAGRL
jgi:hypothetical protein